MPGVRRRFLVPVTRPWPRRASTRSVRTTSSCSSAAAGSSSPACSGHGFKFAPAIGKRSRGPGARDALAEEVALLGDGDLRPRAVAAEVEADDRGGDPAHLPHHEPAAPASSSGARDSGSRAARSRRRRGTPRRPCSGSARRRRARRRSCPCRNGRPKESLTMTPTSSPVQRPTPRAAARRSHRDRAGAARASPRLSRSRRPPRRTRRRSRAWSRR